MAANKYNQHAFLCCYRQWDVKCKRIQLNIVLLERVKIPEIHWEVFPSVTVYCRNHGFDHEERLNYHFLLYNPALLGQ